MRTRLNATRWLTLPIRVLTVALLCGATAYAAEPPQPTPAAIALDTDIQGLKDDTLELNVGLQRLEDDFSFPQHSALSVYVGSAENISAFLSEVTVTIDNAAPAQYTYSEEESRGLLKNGLHRLLRANVAPGLHRVRVEFKGRPVVADKTAAVITETVEGTFNKGALEAEVELRFGKGGKIGMFQGYKRGGKDDPHLRVADFLNADERHFSAATSLLALKPAADSQKLPSDYTWRLAESYLAFGMRARAEELYRELAVTTTDHLALGRARIRLSEFSYSRGFLAESTNSMMRMREKLPDPLSLQWQDLLSRTLMAQGRYGDAVEVLTEMKNGDKQSTYTRYNLAVALINSDRSAEGETLLDKIGRAAPKDTESYALRDKANLTLGYHFLQKGLGGTAKPIFARVRVEGPFSNRALLGMGWAELAPQGEKQKKADIGDEPVAVNPLASLATLGILLNPARVEQDVYKRAGLRNFKLDKIEKTQEANLRRALVPWAELINRDPMDPAVQEGMLAIPFALDRVGAHIEAQQFYEKAVGLLEETRKRLDTASQYIRENRMVETIVRRDIDSEAGWNWRLRDLPDAPETFYLQSVIAQNRYQEALKNYRDVRFLARNLDGFKDRIEQLDSAYSSRPIDNSNVLMQIERAKAGRKPVRERLKLRLKADVQLTAPYSVPVPPVTLPPLSLKLAVSPPKFDGARERSADLRAQLAALRPKIAAAGGEQAVVLQEVALRELAAQKKLVEKYLVEARFALARIYEERLSSKGSP
ncbi:MAG: tetratricopeptide repeat protein [Pseudomonadota bacterium]